MRGLAGPLDSERLGWLHAGVERRASQLYMLGVPLLARRLLHARRRLPPAIRGLAVPRGALALAELLAVLPSAALRFLLPVAVWRRLQGSVRLLQLPQQRLRLHRAAGSSVLSTCTLHLAAAGHSRRCCC